MNKKWNGYLTVEAAFIMPVILLLYLILIVCGFYLYNRCVISQDSYLVAFRGSRFTNFGPDYGEVIYGNMGDKDSGKEYMESRLSYKSGLYPFCHIELQEINTGKDILTIRITGYQGALEIEKKAEYLNIIDIVERTRNKNDRSKIL